MCGRKGGESGPEAARGRGEAGKDEESRKELRRQRKEEKKECDMKQIRKRRKWWKDGRDLK